MSAPLVEESVSLSAKALPKSRILAALDCGSSLLKLVFVDKADVLDRDAESEVPVRVHVYKQQDLPTALQTILDRVTIEDRATYINVTGTGRQKGKDLIESTLGVKVEFVEEFLVTGTGGRVLLEHGRGEIFYPTPQSTVQRIGGPSASLRPREAFLRQQMTANDLLGGALPANFLVMGSAMIFLHVDAAGKMIPTSLPWVGGKSFLGLAELCLGTGDYDEIMTLAASGDFRECYSADNVNAAVFPFGRIATSSLQDSTIRREDIAAALVAFFAQLAHSLGVHVAEVTGRSTIYVSGNWARAACARRSLIEQWSVLHPSVVEYRFFKTGAVSALGALLTEKAAVDSK